MTKMAASATGKKKRFLMDQIQTLTRTVEESLRQEQQDSGMAYTAKLNDTVAALEAQAEKLGVPTTRIFRRKGNKRSLVLDNRPRTLLFKGGLPVDAPLKV